MIGIIGLQQIQVIVKLPLHQLLWKSSTRSLSTAGSSTLDMCSTCCILVYYYTSMYCQTAELQSNLRFKYEMSVAEFGDVGNADYDKAVTKELTTGTRY